MTYQKTTGSLMASGYQKLGTQEAANDMYIVGGVAICIGNGQVHEAIAMEKEICKTLNCMHDQMIILQMIRKSIT